MKMVICDGAVRDLASHKCEERKCKHRKLHKPIKGRCGVRSHNLNDTWCSYPGTQSLIDMGEEGMCVTCMTEAQVRKEELEFNEYMTKDLEAQREKLKKDIELDKKTLIRIDNHIKILKGEK